MAEQARTLFAVVRKLLSLLSMIVIVIFLAFGITLTAYSIVVQSSTRVEAVDSLGRGSAELLARLAVVPLEFDDETELRSLVAEVRQSGTDFQYAAVVDGAGKVVAADPADYTPYGEAVMPEQIVATDIEVGDVPIRHFVAPIPLDEGSFVVHLGFDKTRAAEEAASARTWSILVTLLMTLAGALAVGWTARSILGRLRAVGRQVDGSVHDLRSAAAQIRIVAKQTEENAANEAASVDETRQIMHGLVEAADDIAESAESVAVIAERSSEASGMIAERISTLNEQAMKITDIAEMVRGIADKSDILALNAALEGTKAGEIGRGFSLVGNEMRRLAENVTEAVRDISQLASQIREFSQAAVLASEDGQKLSQETTEAAKRITLVTGQQRSATKQVTQAMHEVQEFTQQAVTGAKQAKETADDLVRTSDELKQMLVGADGAAPKEALRSVGTAK